VVVAIGLSRIAAEHLADHIAEIVHAYPDEAQSRQEMTPLA